MAKKATPRSNARRINGSDVYIGERIREARMAAKMSQDELGKKLGVSFQQIQKYEKGKNRLAGGRFEAIAKALDKPLTFFFQTTDDVRSKADPALSRFIATKEGLRLASDWYRMSPTARGHVMGLISTLVREEA
jgi:transcriptional regulator with XRE-family HTH domain